MKRHILNALLWQCDQVSAMIRASMASLMSQCIMDSPNAVEVECQPRPLDRSMLLVTSTMHELLMSHCITDCPNFTIIDPQWHHWKCPNTSLIPNYIIDDVSVTHHSGSPCMITLMSLLHHWLPNASEEVSLHHRFIDVPECIHWWSRAERTSLMAQYIMRVSQYIIDVQQCIIDVPKHHVMEVPK